MSEAGAEPVTAVCWAQVQLGPEGPLPVWCEECDPAVLLALGKALVDAARALEAGDDPLVVVEHEWRRRAKAVARRLAEQQQRVAALPHACDHCSFRFAGMAERNEHEKVCLARRRSIRPRSTAAL